MLGRLVVACALTLAVSAGASAQSATTGTSRAQNASATQTSSGASTTETRPATTTFFGDTGLWFVPTAEVLAHGKWSASGYRRSTSGNSGIPGITRGALHETIPDAEDERDNPPPKRRSRQ